MGDELRRGRQGLDHERGSYITLRKTAFLM